MRRLTVTLDDADFDALEQQAERLGRTPQELGRVLLRAGLEDAQARMRAMTLVREISQRSGLDEAEGIRVATDEVAAVRADRRASRP